MLELRTALVLRCGLVEYGIYRFFRARPLTRVIRFPVQLGELYQRQFHQQPFVFALAIAQVTVVAKSHRFIEELWGALLRLLQIALTYGCPDFQKFQGRRVAAYE